MKIEFSLRSRLPNLVMGFAMLAIAGSASGQSAERLAQADANGDGNIDWQEMVDMRASTFDRLDRNDDGFADSRDAPRFGPAKSRFNDAIGKLLEADADGDGRISRSEMLDAPAPMFANGDTNGDDVLSADEIAALRETGSGG